MAHPCESWCDFARSDTRTAAERARIIRTSSGAFDSAHRLRAGAWLDITIDSAAKDLSLQAAFLNATVTGGLAAGYLSAYPPGVRPATSNLNFARGQTLANGMFIRLGVVGASFAVRVFVSATCHVIVDLTGFTVTD